MRLLGIWFGKRPQITREWFHEMGAKAEQERQELRRELLQRPAQIVDGVSDEDTIRGLNAVVDGCERMAFLIEKYNGDFNAAVREFTETEI